MFPTRSNGIIDWGASDIKIHVFCRQKLGKFPLSLRFGGSTCECSSGSYLSLFLYNHTAFKDYLYLYMPFLLPSVNEAGSPELLALIDL